MGLQKVAAGVMISTCYSRLFADLALAVLGSCSACRITIITIIDANATTQEPLPGPGIDHDGYWYSLGLV